MIAMQYGFVLPADYDMEIVRRRVAEKGHLLDKLPNLGFKAYLISEKRAGHRAENTYAPVYLWENDGGMTDFLCGQGFVGLSQSFGWPSVKTWFVWEAVLGNTIRRATAATRKLQSLPPYVSLADVRARQSEEAREDVAERGALAAFAAFDPTSWSLVRFSLWENAPEEEIDIERTVYEVLHVSAPGIPE